MNGDIILKTESLCPECLKRIPASYVEEDGKVYMTKDCPEHGNFRALVWSDAEDYRAILAQSVHAVTNEDTLPSERGCPYDCGLCDAHEGPTCTAVLEITYRCNMNCEVCFADTTKHRFEPDLDKIRRMYQAAARHSSDCGIEISGGEPTVRDDIFDIIRMGKDMGFTYIQVNTNGIKIAEEPGYAERLREAGTDLVYLQFDSLRDETYRLIRGRKMLDIKLRAIENCRKANLGVLLVPVMINGVNDDEIGDLVRFAKENMPAVKGIHFQPISYFGRYPEENGRKQWGHMNLADIMRELEGQTGGELKRRHMVSRKRYDSHCAFSCAYYMDENGKLLAITSSGQNSKDDETTDYAAKANKYAKRFWRAPDKEKSAGEAQARKKKTPEERRAEMQAFLERLKEYTLSISGMGFQDAYNIDIGRVKGCCVHVISQDEKAIPLCAYHLTSASGERLYGDE